MIAPKVECPEPEDFQLDVCGFAAVHEGICLDCGYMTGESMPVCQRLVEHFSEENRA